MIRTTTVLVFTFTGNQPPKVDDLLEEQYNFTWRWFPEGRSMWVGDVRDESLSGFLKKLYEVFDQDDSNYQVFTLCKKKFEDVTSHRPWLDTWGRNTTTPGYKDTLP